MRRIHTLDERSPFAGGCRDDPNIATAQRSGTLGDPKCAQTVMSSDGDVELDSSRSLANPPALRSLGLEALCSSDWRVTSQEAREAGACRRHLGREQVVVVERRRSSVTPALPATNTPSKKRPDPPDSTRGASHRNKTYRRILSTHARRPLPSQKAPICPPPSRRAASNIPLRASCPDSLPGQLIAQPCDPQTSRAAGLIGSRSGDLQRLL